jgi:hypothetical protein
VSTRTTVRRTAVLAPVMVVALALGGCASSSSSATPPAASSPAASTPASSAPASSVFALLPESVLADLSPLVYETPAGADASMVAQGAKASVNAVFGGGISRELSYQGKSVGGVTLYRFGPSVAADARAKFVPLMVSSFAQVTPTPGTLGSTSVEVADGARGTGITVIGWTRGDDVVLVWATGVPATQQIAQQYLAQTGG